MSLFVPRSLEDNARTAATEAIAAHTGTNLVGQHVDALGVELADQKTMLKAALLMWAGAQKDLDMITDSLKKLTDQMAANKALLDQKDATIAKLTADNATLIAEVADAKAQLDGADAAVSAAADQLASDDAAASS